MNTGLKNKVVIVTGAGQGIGRGIALAFAAEGARVVVTDMNEATVKQVADEIHAAGGEALAVACDVAKSEAVRDVFARIEEQFGGVDVLVNNAGIYPPVSVADMTEEQWDKVMDVNLKGVFLTSQEAAKVLPDGGSIINISSIASVVGFAGLAHYCASKSGMNGFTRALALELASRSITVNAVAPGAIDTPGASSNSMTEEAKVQMLAAIPLARQGESADIAGAVVFLASDHARYITGQVLVADGGWTLR